jgi:Reverse transcriptase (RNA-dependent DNA polymerase)
MYRGISLSSTLYKILAKILAKQLTKAATEKNLIDETQGVGKFGCASYNEARTLHNIIEDAEENNKELHLGYIDLTKAYDRVERWSLKTTLKKMELPKKFQKLMVEINTGVKAVVFTDYGTIEKFKITRGL